MKQHSTIGVPIAVNSALAKDVAFFLSVAMLCASRGTEFHDMKNPVMSKTRACRNTEDGSLGQWPPTKRIFQQLRHGYYLLNCHLERIPMNVMGAISKASNPPTMEPMLLVNCSHPNAIPRLLSSVESATRD
nr:hypothetical protein BVRB_6g135230 [Ipomoea trifida]